MYSTAPYTELNVKQYQIIQHKYTSLNVKSVQFWEIQFNISTQFKCQSSSILNNSV